MANGMATVVDDPAPDPVAGVVFTRLSVAVPVDEIAKDRKRPGQSAPGTRQQGGSSFGERAVWLHQRVEVSVAERDALAGHREHPAIAASDHGLDVSLFVVGLEMTAELFDDLDETAVADGDIVPGSLDQFVLGDQIGRAHNEQVQHVEFAWRQFHRDPIPKEPLRSLSIP